MLTRLFPNDLGARYSFILQNGKPINARPVGELILGQAKIEDIELMVTHYASIMAPHADGYEMTQIDENSVDVQEFAVKFYVLEKDSMFVN